MAKKTKVNSSRANVLRSRASVGAVLNFLLFVTLSELLWCLLEIALVKVLTEVNKTVEP